MDFCPPFIARRLLGFDTVFKIDDKPDFLIDVYKRQKQAFTDKNNYIASTANEYPFARNARAALWEARAFCLLG